MKVEKKQKVDFGFVFEGRVSRVVSGFAFFLSTLFYLAVIMFFIFFGNF